MNAMDKSAHIKKIYGENGTISAKILATITMRRWTVNLISAPFGAPA